MLTVTWMTPLRLLVYSRRVDSVRLTALPLASAITACSISSNTRDASAPVVNCVCRRIRSSFSSKIAEMSKKSLISWNALNDTRPSSISRSLLLALLSLICDAKFFRSCSDVDAFAMTEFSASSVSFGTPVEGNLPNASSLVQSTLPRIHACSISSFAVGRLLGSTWSILWRIACASSDSHMGIVYSPAVTFSKSCTIFSSSNGRQPAKITYKTTPRDQMSAAHPSYGTLLITSGAA
mmetsp:Transcript_7422/g.20230  ORF Transcript_7422/g.20230 Transcript_7422/m.20230 type:complete len:237 (+) Transcript_7422:6545-7255(+)